MVSPGFSFTACRFLPHHKYGRRFISGIPGFSSFLVYSNIPQTNCSNKSHVYVSIFASRATYKQRVTQCSCAISHRVPNFQFFAEELLNRQVLVGYLLLSYNDNLLRRKRKNRTLNPSKPFLPKTTWERGCCNFTREKSTSYPGRQAKADFQFLLRCFIDDDVTFILMFSMCIILQLVSRK